MEYSMSDLTNTLINNTYKKLLQVDTATNIGVDASLIYSDGIDKFEAIKDKYFEYDANIYKDIHSLYQGFSLIGSNNFNNLSESTNNRNSP